MNTEKIDTHLSLTEAAGFTAAHRALDSAQVKARQVADRARRMTLAYEHFRVAKPEKVQAFRDKLRLATQQASSEYEISYDTLAFTPVEKYATLPPAEVLAKVAEAKKLEVFDAMEVAWIKTERIVADPIVFGRITGCGDRFFIAQWGEDVKISDLLADNEG